MNDDGDDDEEMTHRGTKISQLTTFDAPTISDDDDSDEEEATKIEKNLSSA